jgi:hypothetical protein
MRDFRLIIRIDMILVAHGWHHSSMRGSIAAKFVGDQPSGLTALVFDETAEEPFCCQLIAATLHKNINDISVLIDRPIQIMSLSLQGNKNFVDMPRIA